MNASQFEPEQQRLSKELTAAKSSILELLKDQGIARATMEYDAYGDSGQIDTIHATDASSKDVSEKLELQPQPGTRLREVLEELGWELLQHLHDGFENGEGGCGEIIVDVAAGTIALDHNDRIVETLNTKTEV